LRVGGRYTAVDNGDGTFNILDVPIFAEIPAGVKRNADPVGREWQEAAVAKSLARQAEGHLPPVHIYHSDETAVKPIHAGKFMLKVVRPITYEGRQLWATFADIVGVPGDVFEKIRRGFLPYRSVEIHNWDKPEIDSLALMDTDVPFFRLPMMTVGQVLRSEAEYSMDKTRPAQAFRLGKKSGGVILFRFAEGRDMPDKENDKEDPKDESLNSASDAGETPKESEADLDVQAEADGNKATGSETPDAPEAEMADEGESAPGPDAEKPEAILESGEHVQKETQALAAIQSQLQSFGQILQKVLERLGPQPQTQEKLEPVQGVDVGAEATAQFKDMMAALMTTSKEDEDMADKQVQQPKVTLTPDELAAFASKAAEAAVLKATAPMMAKLAKFEADREDEAKKAKQVAAFSAAVKDLEDSGFAVTDALRAHLEKSAAHGADFLKEQVAVFKSTLPPAPPADPAEFESSLADESAAAGPDGAVNAFCAKYGAKHAGFAREQLKAYSAFKLASGSEITAEEWLETNFRAASNGRVMV
jgi:hypothetical protein